MFHGERSRNSGPAKLLKNGAHDSQASVAGFIQAAGQAKG